MSSNQTDQTVDAVIAAESTIALLARSGVEGAAASKCDGRDCIKVYLSQPESSFKPPLPGKIGGYRVVYEVTGGISAGL